MPISTQLARGLVGDKVPFYPIIGSLAPTMAADFMNNRYMQAGVTLANIDAFMTTTRASTGTAYTTAGGITSFSNNVTKRTNRGLLVEEARTNIKKYSNDITQTGAFDWIYSNSPTIAVNNVTGKDGTTNGHKITATSTTSALGRLQPLVVLRVQPRLLTRSLPVLLHTPWLLAGARVLGVVRWPVL